MKKIILILVITLLAGCSNYYQFNDYLRIWKSMSYDQFKKAIGNNAEGYSIRVNGFEYWVFPFEMKTEKQEESRPSSGSQYNNLTGRYENASSSQVVSVPVINYYYFVFKDDRLFYYGFLYEMRRHNDSEILEIGESIYNHNLSN